MSLTVRAFALAVLVALVACTPPRTAAPRQERTPSPVATAREATLPRGGREILPHYRVVAYYGAPDVPAMGVLGQGKPEDAARKLLAQARAYDRYGRAVLPAFELIATVAQSDPGAAGMYSGHVDDADVDRYIAAARAVKAITILDIQPGRRRFIDEFHRLRHWLEAPDVGLALDPEWHMNAGQVPGEEIGSTTAAAINGVSAELSALVEREHLPQKLLVVHQFVPDMIANERAILPRRNLAIVIHADGFGPRDGKVSKYDLFAHKPPFFNGFKLFYQQDTNMFSAREVMQLKPQPDLVTYE